MTVILTTLLALLMQPAPAANPGADLPLVGVTLYRNNVAYLRRSGEIPVAQGVARLNVDPETFVETWTCAAHGQKILRSSVNPTGPLLPPRRNNDHSEAILGQELIIQLPDGAVTGVVTAITPYGGTRRWALRTSGGTRLFPESAIQGMARTAAPVAEIELESKEVSSARFDTAALVAGTSWSPTYHLVLGPEGDGKLSMAATIRNLSSATLDAPAVSCSLLTPDISGTDELRQDATTFSIGAVKVASGKLQQFAISERDLQTKRYFEWVVGGPSTDPKSDAIADQVQSIIALKHDGNQTLPGGPLSVTQAGELIAISRFPETAAGASAEIGLGTTQEVVVRREEVELERKRAVSEEEETSVDWVSMTGTLVITNPSPRTAHLRVIKSFEGDATAASDNGQIQRKANRIGRERAPGEIRWDIDLSAGGTKKLTYGYQLLLKAEGK